MTAPRRKVHRRLLCACKRFASKRCDRRVCKAVLCDDCAATDGKRDACRKHRGILRRAA